MGEDERRALSALVAAKIADLGMTEVARITGLSTTALREYANEGINPGVRAATISALRRLEMPTGPSDVLDRAAAIEARLDRVELQLGQMIELLRDLDRRIQGTSQGDGEEA